MSYILDALRKSEQEREFSRVLTPPDDAGGFSGFMRRPLWPLAVGLTLVLIVLATSVRVWWEPTRPAAAVVPPPPPPAVAMPAPVPVKVATPKTSKAQVKPEVRGLAEQLAVAPPKAKRKRTVKTRPLQPARAGTDNPPAPTQTASVAPEIWQAARDPNVLPFLRQMPEHFRRNIPKMTINVHLYSADEEENLVYINNRQYRKGEKIEGGVLLEAIVQEGVVMSYEGTRFMLPRPN